MTNNVRRIGALSLMLAGATILSACDDVVEEITADDRPVLKMVVGPGAAVLPTASAVTLGPISRVVDFDVSAADAFGRATANHAFDDGVFQYGDSDILDAAGNDGRTPSVGGGDLTLGAYDGGRFRVFGADANGGDMANWFGGFVGSSLVNGTQYWVGLARMGVNVNGALDQTGVLRSGSADAADALVFVGGTPGGDGNRFADEFNDGASGRPPPFPAEPNANPFVLGSLEVGIIIPDELVIDFVFTSTDAAGNPVYHTTAEGFVSDRAPIGPNDGTALTGIQYNYLVVWDADPLLNANPNVLFRIQLAADLEGSSMTPVNNGYAPYPSAALSPLDLLAAPGGTATGAFGVPESVTLSLTGLSDIGMSYGVWLFGEGGYQPAASFTSPGSGETTPITIVDTDLGLDFVDFTHVVVAPGAASGGAPSSAGFLFQEYPKGEGLMTFGSFGAGGDDKPFAILGAGAGEFFKDSLFIDLSRVGPPPSGFHYQSFLVAGSGGSVRLHTVTLDVLGNGQDRIAASEAGGDFGSYNFYTLVLEPDNGSVLTEMQIQASEDYAGKFSEFFTR